jgi:OOP family OmpA-OmpF porin
MKKICLSAAIAAAALSVVPVQAQSWYFGFGVGSGNLNKSGQDLTGLPNASVEDNDTTYTARLGYRFNPFLAIEGGYYDLGHYNFSSTVGSTVISGSAKAKSFGLSAVGIVPLGRQFEAYGRLGIESSELKANANTTLLTASDSDRQTGATYGVGARWKFTPTVGLFAEWMKNDKIEVDSYFAGIDFRF